MSIEITERIYVLINIKPNGWSLTIDRYHLLPILGTLIRTFSQKKKFYI